ncbi:MULTISPECIES: autoinducer binding domain-containing protein [unclassified Mesorhizobium]|uniref:autoinducer binding domain-containing protein n=1 Tax=unclassified Mesorhizobium TaxID=325217 RepID=UPI00167AD719
MQSVFERFLEQLSEGVDEVDFHSALAYVSSQFDLLAFAYLSLPPRPGDKPMLISNYPAPWTARYLEHQYQSIDPVIVRARVGGCPFRWGSALPDVEPSEAEQRVFDEAAQFGICCGLTIPIIDLRGNFAAMTFAADKRDPAFSASRTAMTTICHTLRPVFTSSFDENCPLTESLTVCL